MDHEKAFLKSQQLLEQRENRSFKFCHQQFALILFTDNNCALTSIPSACERQLQTTFEEKYTIITIF